MRLLLIGATGSPFYEHCEHEIREFIGGAARIGILPAANLFDEKAYFQGLWERLAAMFSPKLQDAVHVQWNSNWRDALNRIDALIVPGGNTYALLQRLQRSELLGVLRDRVRAGLPYIGSSAGANIVGPNILTTNDWNIVEQRDFTSLGLVPCNINPHYVERGAADAQHSETRDLRIREYHHFKNNLVLGLEETGVLKVVDSQPTLIKGRAKVFLPGSPPRWLEAGQELVWQATLTNATPAGRADKRLAAF